MIEKLTIRNIQSHKETTLDFNAGVNVILGSSNNGKTAILRGLYWLVYNRPLGIDNLASHWILDDKGNLGGEMSVTAKVNGNTVARKRTKNENLYIVNDKILETVKSDVPDEVSNILKLNETNIQKQQDAPFLLSLSNGDVAKYFNRIVRLDVIDKVLSNAESKRRKNKQEIEHKKILLEQKKNEHENYGWIPDAEKLLVKYNRVEENNNLLNEQLSGLRDKLNEYEKYISIIENVSDVLSSKKIIEKIDDENEKINSVQYDRQCLLNDIREYESQLPVISYDFETEKKLIKKIENITVDKCEMNDLMNSIDDYYKNYNMMNSMKIEIETNKKLLPKICPYCNQPFNVCGGNE